MSLHPHSDKTRKEAALCIQKWTRGYLCRRTIETARAAKERISRYDEDIERQVHAVRGIEMWWARVAGLSLSESQESTHTESSASSSVLSTASQLVTRLVSRVMESACTTSPVDPSLQEEIYSFYHPANADSPPLASPSPDAISSHLLSACLMRNENDGDALLNTIFSTPNAISSLCAEEAMLRGDHINTFFMSHFTVEELLWRGMIDVEERKGWGEVRTEAHGSALEVVVMEVEGTERQGRAEVLEEEWESWTNLISTSNAGGVEAFYSEELLARSGIEGMRDSGISELLSSCRDSVVRKRNSIHQREWYATLATTIATETSARDSIFSAECSEFSDTISVSFLITSEILSRSSLFSNWIATFTPFISFIETHQRSFIETEGFALCTSLYSKVAAKNADNIIQIETKERSLIVIEEGRVYNEVQSILDAAEGLEERQAVVELYKAAEVEVAGLLPPLREGLAEKGATCIDASAVKEARQQLRELQKAYNEVCCTMCDARTLTNRLLGITKEREMLQGRLDTHVFHQLRLETAVAECEAECASLRNTYLDSENTTNAFQSIQRLEEIATQHRATRVQHITGAAEVSQQLSDTTLQRSTEVQLLKLTMHRDTPDRLYALYSSVAASVAALPQPAVTLPEEIDETSYVATAYERYIASALPGGGGGGDTPPRRQSVREIREGLQRKASMKKEETQPLHPPHPPKNPRRQSEPLDVEMTEEDLMQDEAVQRARIVCSAVPDVVEVQAFVTVGESMLRECISSAAVESMPTPTPPPISHTQQQIEADIEDQAMLEVKLLAIIEREDEQRSAILLSQDRVRTTLGTLEVRAGADARLRQCAATTGSKRKQAALAAQSLLAQCTPSQRRESTIQEVLAAVCAGGGGGGGGEMPSTQMVNQAVCAIVRGDDVTVCTFVAKWQALMTATMQDIMEGTALSQRCAGQDQMPSWENTYQRPSVVLHIMPKEAALLLLLATSHCSREEFILCIDTTARRLLDIQAMQRGSRQERETCFLHRILDTEGVGYIPSSDLTQILRGVQQYGVPESYGLPERVYLMDLWTCFETHFARILCDPARFTAMVLAAREAKCGSVNAAVASHPLIPSSYRRSTQQTAARSGKTPRVKRINTARAELKELSSCLQRCQPCDLTNAAQWDGCDDVARPLCLLLSLPRPADGISYWAVFTDKARVNWVALMKDVATFSWCAVPASVVAEASEGCVPASTYGEGSVLWTLLSWSSAALRLCKAEMCIESTETLWGGKGAASESCVVQAKQHDSCSTVRTRALLESRVPVSFPV